MWKVEILSFDFYCIGGQVAIVLKPLLQPAFEKSAVRLGPRGAARPAPPLLSSASPTFLSCPPAPMPSGGGSGGRAGWNGGDSDGRQR